MMSGRLPLLSSALAACRRVCTGCARPFSTAAPAAPSVAEKQAWITSLAGSKLAITSLNDRIFGAPLRRDILHRVVTWQLAKRRAGVATVKTRGEVQGSTRKIFPQKGRGRARHGSIRAPIFVGGGRVHGPHHRSYDYTLPKKVRKLGLKVALAAKYAQGDLDIVDKVTLATHKTKHLHELLRKRGVGERCKALIVGGDELTNNVKLASLNLPYCTVMPSRGINVYDVLTHRKVVLSVDALDYLNRLLDPK